MAPPEVRTPDISVAIPSHERPLRLLWLLNALEEQTLERDRFEVVVAHDSRDDATEDVLRRHPLAEAGVLRHLRLPPRPGPPGANRNAAWRAARAPLVAFTDDDCRPPPEWLEAALAAAARSPGAIVQGATRPDPDELDVLHAAPHVQTQTIDPPVAWAQTCNIVYPLEVLERLGGFDEGSDALVGEDTDLAMRARAAGVPYAGASEALTYHAVIGTSIVGRLARVWRWRRLPGLVRRHPSLRREFTLGLFWKPSHARLPPALLGLALSRRRPAALLLVLPWALAARSHRGTSARGVARAAGELPGRLVVDVAELVTMAWGSVRHRTPLL